MYYNIVCIILILAKGVQMQYNETCAKISGPIGEEVDLDKECKSQPCLVKCCGPNEIYFKTKFLQKCMSVEELVMKYPKSSNISDQLLTYSGLKVITTDGGNSSKTYKDFHILYRKYFNTDEETCSYVKDQTDIKVNENGVLPVYTNGLKAPNFCMEIFIRLTKDNKTIPIFNYIAMYDPPTDEDRKYMFIAYGNLVSILFLFLLLVIYGLLKQLHNNIHGMLLMAFVASHLLFMIFTTSILLYEFEQLKESVIVELDGVCEWLSPIAYFLVLSAFFWLNTMSFDMWWTFRGMRKVREIHRRGIYVKFLTYAAYAWGLPAAITIVAVVIDNSELPENIKKPRFKQCQPDYGMNEARLYKYLPVFVLVTANIVFYLLTIYNIWAVQNSVKGFDKDNKQNKKNKNQFIIYFKLSIVMGLNWLIEIIENFTTTESASLFMALNIFNVLIGLVIFVILICRRSVFVMLCRRFKIENRWTRRSTHTKSTTHTDRTKASLMQKTKSTDDSIQIYSCNFSTDDNLKTEQSQHPCLMETRM